MTLAAVEPKQPAFAHTPDAGKETPNQRKPVREFVFEGRLR